MTIEKKLLGTNPVDGAILPEAVSFDGTNDYLARTSDFTNNADGKTWTFSAWFYAASNGSSNIYSTYQNRVSIIFEGSYLNISLKSTTEDAMFESYPNIAQNTWNHILISCNQASTSQRHIYVNDKIYTQFNTYVNGNIDFTETQHYIGAANANHIYKMKGRIAHVFLDKTYRDLSVTANRRLFITADGKPSDTIPSNPIMYLPMKDAATAGVNSGTGGNFAAAGVLATAERGPNQDNCSASTFDGSADYLTRASIGASNSKLFTVSGTINVTGGDGLVCRFYKNGHGTLFQITTNIYGSLFIKAYNAVYQNRFYVQWKNSIGANNALMPNHNYHFSLSVDMSDTSKRHLIINGAAVSPTYTHYTNVEMGFSAIDLSRVGFVSGDGYFAGDLGELYFNTTYTDLSADNPFWDSDTNRPNSVRKVIADTSVTPLVALPLMGRTGGQGFEGNNLGSGGDFNVVSGPFTGARGGSEFYARSAEGTGASGISLTRSGGIGGVSVANITAVFAVYLDTANSQKVWFGCGGNHWVVYNDASGNVKIGNAYEDSNVSIGTSGSPFATGEWHTVLFSMVSNGNSSQRHIYVDGLIPNSVTWSQSRSTFDLSATTAAGILSDTGGGQNLNGKLSSVYLEQVYTDFSQEVNRNKFIDQLGYMKDLSEEGSPLIYMKFDPSVSLGTNSGSGGNFTVNGAVTAGEDFTP